MKIIPIKLPNKLASVPCRLDDEDYEWASKFKWHAAVRGKTIYAARNGFRNGKRVSAIYLHREILRPPKGKLADHINMDGLDNRRANLRIGNKSGNSGNRGLISTNTSGFKGVYWDKKICKWIANTAITVDGKAKHIHLGCFKEKLDAAKAYNEAALKHFGQFARLNEV